MSKRGKRVQERTGQLRTLGPVGTTALGQQHHDMGPVHQRITTSIIQLSRRLPARMRLELMLAGAIATADELGMTDDQIVLAVKAECERRRDALRKLRQEPLLLDAQGNRIPPSSALGTIGATTFGLQHGQLAIEKQQERKDTGEPEKKGA